MEYIGIWNPLVERALPELESSYRNGAWLIKNSGEIDGINYVANTWLVAITNVQGTVEYGTVETLLHFNDTSSTAVEPGWYTKIRVGANGNILLGDFLEESDIPDHEHSASQINNLKEKLIEILKTLFGGGTESAVVFSWNEETQSIEADVKIDEDTVGKNEYGQLVSLGGTGEGNPNSGQCSQEVELNDLKDIDGIDEWILNIVSNVFKFNINDYIDEETIITNSSGKISAIAIKTQPHTHEIEDINGLEERLIWAVNQNLNENTTGLDFNDGALNLANKTIGASIVLINQTLRSLNSRIEGLEARVGRAEPSEPVLNPGALEVSSDTIVECYDLQGQISIRNCPIVDCFYGTPKISFNRVYPTTGVLDIYVDNSLLQSVVLDDVTETTTSGSFRRESVEDYYKDLEQFRGFYNCSNYSLTLDNITEGSHKLYTVHTVGEESVQSPEFKFNTLTQTEPSLEVTYSQQEVIRRISGIPAAGSNALRLTFEALSVFSSRYLPTDTLVSTSIFGTDYSLQPSNIDGNKIVFDLIETFYPENYQGILTVESQLMSRQVPTLNSTNLPWFRYDGSTLESDYRVLFTESNLTWSDFDNTAGIGLTSESCIVRGLMLNENYDYSNFGGYDYSSISVSPDSKGYRYVALKFDFDNIILPSHLSFTLENANGSNLSRNTKTGLFRDLTCVVGLISGEKCLATLTSDQIYDFTTRLSQSNKNYPSLDLYETEDNKIVLTLGKNSTIKNINSCIIKIGCATSNSINLNTLCSSFQIC